MTPSQRASIVDELTRLITRRRKLAKKPADAVTPEDIRQLNNDVLLLAAHLLTALPDPNENDIFIPSGEAGR